MSIYNDHVAYAKKIRMPIHLAKTWCDHQLELQKEIDKARYCPKCGKPTLELESGSYEEGYSDYVHCENDEVPFIDEDGEDNFTDCGYAADPAKEHIPLSSWYDFDPLLAFSCGMIEQEFGSLQEWLKFVRKEVEKIKPKVSA